MCSAEWAACDFTSLAEASGHNDLISEETVRLTRLQCARCSTGVAATAAVASPA